MEFINNIHPLLIVLLVLIWLFIIVKMFKKKATHTYLSIMECPKTECDGIMKIDIESPTKNVKKVFWVCGKNKNHRITDEEMQELIAKR